MFWPIGYEGSGVFGSDSIQRQWWIGKPWRRAEVMLTDSYYRGERVDRVTDVSLHIGSRRLGIHATIMLGHQTAMDYSESPL